MAECRFENRVAVITGAGRGLGRTYALLLASKGAKVVVNDPGGSLRGDGIELAPAESVVQEIKALGGEAVASTESVATPAGGKAIIQTALDHYGRIDVLVHNAGNVRRGFIKEISFEDFDAVLDVHLRGGFNVVRAAFPHMLDKRYGRIVLTSSIGGFYGNRQVVNYSVSKAGLIGLCNTLALEGAADNVKCNIILPGAVTRMAEGLDISQYPPMEPELVAPVVGYLCHESCESSGEYFVSVGGRVARAYVAETPGVYRPSWTIDQVKDDIDAIRNSDQPVVFPVLPYGFGAHLGYSFDMAKKAIAAAKAGGSK